MKRGISKIKFHNGNNSNEYMRFLFTLTILLFLSIPLTLALTAEEEQTKINQAYSCLQNKTSGKCSTLSLQEKIFSKLAVNQCTSELMADSTNSGECWPSGNCRVKDTAQAMLALKSNSPATVNWLYSKNAASPDLTWYVEIESVAPTTCTINYLGSSYSISIDENKKLDANAGSCLLLDQDDYWLRVSQSCYNTEFSFSCSEDFLTTTLFKKQDSSTVHVSSETSSAAALGLTTETINSYCFADSGSCTYEGTLWAALALDSAGEDISAYLPYLITFADENPKYVPDSFLYQLTANSDYKLSLLSQQKGSQYWMESGDRYYDTAVALYPLQQDTSREKTNAKNWLLSSQGSNGCWENNIRNTGFILASVWPGSFSGTGSGDDGGGSSGPSCESQGKYCSSSAECTLNGGSVLDSYSCSGFSEKCCSIQPLVKTCAELGGEICSSNQRCIGGTEPGAADLSSGQICCASGGYCSTTTGTGELTDCELNDGVCKTSSCNSNEEESSYSCESFSETCCVQESTSGDGGTNDGTSTSGGSLLWVWVLLIFIVLIVIGILLREKLRMLWFRFKMGSRSSGSSARPGSGPRPPYFPPYMPPRTVNTGRRILTPQPHSSPRPISRMKSGAQKELDEVLRKLKEMGK